MTLTEPVPGTRWNDDKGVAMVYVPAGTFLMGSTQSQVDEALAQFESDRLHIEYVVGDANWFVTEMPQHEQNIRHAFWLDLTPVTNESYAHFKAEGGYQERAYWTSAGWQWVQDHHETGEYPLGILHSYSVPDKPRMRVTWFEAYAYCRWRGGRLPTEAEWEWAARGPQNSIYPWGAAGSYQAHWYNPQGGNTSPVAGGKRTAGASWIGAQDMSGNVWEWCNSLYQPYPYTEDDGRENIEDGLGNRVVRGGDCFIGSGAFGRCATRTGAPPNAFGMAVTGLRCARTIES